MPKITKSFRVEGGLWARLEAAKADGETASDALTRALEAGLDALEGRDNRPAQASDGEEVAAKDEAAQAQPLQAVVDAQAAHIADLQTRLAKSDEQLATKDGQLAAKDERLEALEAITKAAQAMQAMNAKQITDGSEGRFKRAWRAFRKEA